MTEAQPQRDLDIRHLVDAQVSEAGDVARFGRWDLFVEAQDVREGWVGQLGDEVNRSASLTVLPEAPPSPLKRAIGPP